MSDTQENPLPTPCPANPAAAQCVQLWPARDVPLGGVRGVTVSRTLPQRGMPTVGAWCFLDSFGPAEPHMSVLPHPNIGLQTVTWPLAGVIRHRDSLGSDVLLRARELNLMTAGDGVAHSEFSWLGDADSDSEAKSMRGLQLWVALPEDSRHGPALFEQHRELPQFSCDSLRVIVLFGELAGHRSPATVFTPIVGAEITASAGKSSLPIKPDVEHAILLLDGELQIDGETLVPGPLAYLGAGRSELAVQVNEFARFVLIGGEPFTEDLLMWWNFVTRSQEEIETARADWQAQSARFPTVAGHRPDAGSEADWIPAPPLPTVKLTPRRRNSSAKPS